MRRVVLLVVAALLVGGVAFALTRDENKPEDEAASPPPATQNVQEPAPTPPAEQQTAMTITYDGSGFSPANLTVKARDTVTIRNTSPNQLQFHSDPHPQHTENDELNVGIVADGESKTFTVNRKGSFGYHNHLNSSEGGSITVQ